MGHGIAVSQQISDFSFLGKETGTELTNEAQAPFGLKFYAEVTNACPTKSEKAPGMAVRPVSAFQRAGKHRSLATGSAA
jgi:hypothetical protein